MDLTGTGNGQHNLVIGNSGNNHLNGAWGNDTLIGGAGDDTLVGGPGYDQFVVADGSDRDEILNFKMGIDKIKIAGLDFDGPDAATKKAAFLSEHGSLQNKDLFIDLGDGDSVYLPDIVPEEEADPRVSDFSSVLF